MTPKQKLEFDVATKIFGCKVQHRTPPLYGSDYLSCQCGNWEHGADDPNNDILLSYASEIGPAMSIIPELLKGDSSLQFFIFTQRNRYEIRCTIKGIRVFAGTCANFDDLPANICRAALAVVNYLDKKK